jgi:fatty-acid desaturase
LTAALCFLLVRVVLAWQIKNNYWFSWRELGMTVIFGYFKLVVAFTILHRFFAHKAFSASRPVAFFLGLVALTVSNTHGAGSKSFHGLGRFVSTTE